MRSLATIQSSALTVAQKQSLETFYRAFSDKKPQPSRRSRDPGLARYSSRARSRSGSEGMKPLMQMFFTAFPDLQIIVDDAIAQPDRAGVRARMVATHRGKIFGLQPTGKPISIALHEFHRFDRDRITHTWHLKDWFGMLHQIGAWPLAPMLC